MTTLKEALAGKLTTKELDSLRASFDVIGDIAIIEVPRELKKRAKLIGSTLKKLLPTLRTVAMKAGGHTGKYRRQKLTVIAGETGFETLQKESGIAMKLDVEKCYYSQRLGTERLRIAALIKPGEHILVAGSGVGPYPLVLARHSKAELIVGVELNPVAHLYAKENIVINKMNSRIECVRADVTKVIFDPMRTFDRIIVAMPHGGVDFVPSLLRFAKKGTNIHILDFASEEDIKEPARRLVVLCKEAKRKCTITGVGKAGQHAVRSYRICIDAKVS